MGQGARGTVNLARVLVSESLQVGVADLAGTAVVGLFSYFFNPTESWRCRWETRPRNVNCNDTGSAAAMVTPPTPSSWS